MPARKVSRREIVAAARAILETDGPDALTMRALGERLGIRAPSLYHHFPDKASVQLALIATGLLEQALTFEAAVSSAPGEPLRALATAYRAYARRHPHLYRLITERPLPRERLPEGLEARAVAPVVVAAGGDPDRARAVRAFAHGMVVLELTGRFPPDADLDAAWRAGIAALARR
jgi:AcrR family transcriptional regulator